MTADAAIGGASGDLALSGHRAGHYRVDQSGYGRPDWKEMVKSDLRNKTNGTFLDGCEIVEFSAQDCRNLDVVKTTVEKILKSVQREAPGDSARLYIDRVFTIAGTGTVVTGTLREGDFTVGQEVWHHPSTQKTRIKTLESFYSHLDKALPACGSPSDCNHWSEAQSAVGICCIRRGNLNHRRYWASSCQLNPNRHTSSSIIGGRVSACTSEVEGRFFLSNEPVVCDDGALIAYSDWMLRLSSKRVIGLYFVCRHRR